MDAILAIAYPSIYRIAAGLSGRRDVADGIVGFVIKAAMRQQAGWQRLDEPIRWFWHYTVLTARRAKKHHASGPDDVLIPPALPIPPTPPTAARDSGYLAYIHALRSLHFQQREAFILRHGENLDPRQLAIAMDCSITAAANHLSAATQNLSLAAGGAFATYTNVLSATYAALTPPQELHLPAIKNILQRREWSRLARTAGAILAGLALAAGCLYAIHLVTR